MSRIVFYSANSWPNMLTTLFSVFAVSLETDIVTGCPVVFSFLEMLKTACEAQQMHKKLQFTNKTKA